MALLAAAALAAPGAAAPDETGSAPARPTAVAVRVDQGAVHVDGRLDEAVWQQAPAQGGFRQRDPADGQPATEETQFRVCYDADALYVGVRCFDRQPERIVTRLTRRDGDIEADWICLSLDPRLDSQSGFWFSVYASGAVADGVYSGDRDMDASWDSVWEASTSRDGGGWVAEYRIPYHALRFGPRAEYVWGLNVERHISRKQERAQWSLISRGQTGLVSRFGRLEGLRGFTPPLHLEAVPYALGQVTADHGEDWYGSVGADLRYGTSSGTSLNVTINPDFGQVEADPATLNLTAYEEFYGERRPFFLEGAATFTNANYYVFHSRRIGRRPGYLPVPDGTRELSRPMATTILGAVKLTGKTAGRTTFGLLDAVTAREYARVEPDTGGARRQVLVEPLTNYLVGRATQDLRDGTSMVGAMATAVSRQEGSPAYVGLLDWDLRYLQDRYQVTGALIGTRTGGPPAREHGYIAHLELDKRGGWLEAETGLAAVSPHADLNDVGYLRRNDQVSSWAYLIAYRHDPWGPLQRLDFNPGWDVAWNCDGMVLANGISASLSGDSRSNWWLHLDGGRNLRRMDDDDVRRGGPVIRRPAENWVHFQIDTDDRRPFSFTFRPEVKRHDGGASHERSLTLAAAWRPRPSLWFSVTPVYVHGVADAQWVQTDPDPAAPGGVHYVYGRLDRQTLDLTTRAQMNFAPELSLELYLQPFVAIGDFRSFKELVAARTYRFQPYELAQDHDFHHRWLNSNVVLRWEFRPGSALYAIWSQARYASQSQVTADDLELRPLRRLANAFTDPGSNVFLVKVSRWYGR